MTLLEICLDDLGGAAIAEENGADRIELCADLPHGGTTPSLGTVSAALASITSVGVQVLIRQRPGDFVYRGLEIDAMVRDIEVIAALSRPPGVTVGFVVGALRDDGRIDVPVMTRLLRACGPAPVTLHRAFDATAHPLEALEVAVDLGIHRVLTAGGPGSADTQLDGLATLVRAAAGRISILAAGGIRAHNVAEVVRRTGVGEVHLRATPTTSPSATGLSATSAEVIRAVRTELT